MRMALFGTGPMLTLSGLQISFGAALWRLVLVVGYIAAIMAALGAIGLFVSTLTEQPIGAMILAALWLGERLSPIQAVGGALALAGVGLVRRD